MNTIRIKYTETKPKRQKGIYYAVTAVCSSGYDYEINAYWNGFWFVDRDGKKIDRVKTWEDLC